MDFDDAVDDDKLYSLLGVVAAESISFGKHKGKSIKDLPASYLKWLADRLVREYDGCYGAYFDSVGGGFSQYVTKEEYVAVLRAAGHSVDTGDPVPPRPGQCSHEDMLP